MKGLLLTGLVMLLVGLSSKLVCAESDRLVIIGQQQDIIHDYVKQVGVPQGIMMYTSIQETEGLEFPADKGGGVQYGQYYLTHYPKAVLQLALYMRHVLKDIPQGKYDKNIKHLAQWMKRAKRPIYFRIGYEFDLPENQYDPREYVEAYRYIVDVLRGQGVSNVLYVWHTAAAIEPMGKFMNWYPGDDYVDYFAVSFFSSGQTATCNNFAKLAQAHYKPLMIAEASPAGMYSVRGQKDWFNRYFDLIEKHDIKVVSYINSNWDNIPMFKSMSWGDARIERHPELKEMWLKFLSGESNPLKSTL